LATVILSPNALDDLDRLISTLTLPANTRARVRRSLEALREFPHLGAPLGGRWSGYRFVLGPWRWMIVVYEIDDAGETVGIVTIQDARSARAVTEGRH
jgi:plasmid stabilization system protein ParE